MEAMEDFYERLLADDQTKDVEIHMLDGTVRAHSAILCVASDAIRGMLSHGEAVAGSAKQLSWREHSLEVGRFFLQLLYTGTVERVDGEVPLRVLLGSLGIAAVYLVPHLCHAVTEALKRRLSDNTFDEICAAAIKLDVTALRLHCLHHAQRDPKEVRLEDLRDGMSVRALRRITVEAARVPRGDVGKVVVDREEVGEEAENGPADVRIEWESGYANSADRVLDALEAVRRQGDRTLRERYEAKELSPEVMSELAAIWGAPMPPAKRRRCRKL